ncbi:LuxR C-terminal-related transcriptional regulator [Microbispora sp. NPDC046933]|uniref:helix-turn-helix transcriptional regulator n=1 Tax=Microbispora sp. NPDC046933 TaxID=3155618 RepID=UPI003406A84D
MRSATVRDVREAVADLSRRADSPLALERAVAAQVARVVPADLWCALTIDPDTHNISGGFHDEGLPFRLLGRLTEIEQQETDPDVLTMRELVRSGVTARTLAQATGGDLVRSHRFRDVLSPSGVGHEVRVAFRAQDGRVWGAMVLMRGTDVPDFAARELGVLRAISQVVADGLRRATVLSERPPTGDDGPGLLLCRVAGAVVVEHTSASARRLLDEIDDGRLGDLPYTLASLVHAAHRRAACGAPHRVRIRVRTGRWLTAHAERLGEDSVSVILEATRPHEIMELLADAYRLTARERQIATLAGRGLTNKEIGSVLFLSAFTVQDHLKAVFAKTGVRSRSELASLLHGHTVAPPE